MGTRSLDRDAIEDHLEAPPKPGYYLAELAGKATSLSWSCAETSDSGPSDFLHHLIDHPRTDLQKSTSARPVAHFNSVHI